MDPVTILQVIPRLDAGGSELATVEITEALTQAGAISIVATQGGRMEDAVTQLGGEVIKLPVASRNPLVILANVRRLTRLIECRNVSAIHARSRAPGWSAFFAARRTGRPFVTTYHGAYSENGIFKKLYNSVMARGDRIIANSLFTANLIASRQPKARECIRLVYRGIDTDVFNPVAVTSEAIRRIRERWGVTPETKIILHAARLTGIKGHRDLIAAAVQLAKRDGLRHGIIIIAGDVQGREAYRQELRDLVSHHGLVNKVRLVDHCSDMAAAFLAAHVAVMPSLVPETFGRASVEAQAMGCPPIVSALGALPETIIAEQDDPRGFTGWLVTPNDPESLANRIQVALSLTPYERVDIGVRARKHAAKFDLRHMQQETLSVYDELLGTDLANRFSGALGSRRPSLLDESVSDVAGRRDKPGKGQR
jgi:glycosyltransferase involved in cell wall biosynthesis